MLSKAWANIAGLVRLSDELATGKTTAEAALKKALAEVGALSRENCQMDRRINGLLTVANQRDHLFRENKRLLGELTAFVAPDNRQTRADAP